jgi:hypothetical protein
MNHYSNLSGRISRIRSRYPFGEFWPERNLWSRSEARLAMRKKRWHFAEHLSQALNRSVYARSHAPHIFRRPWAYAISVDIQNNSVRSERASFNLRTIIAKFVHYTITKRRFGVQLHKASSWPKKTFCGERFVELVTQTMKTLAWHCSGCMHLWRHFIRLSTLKCLCASQ